MKNYGYLLLVLFCVNFCFAQELLETEVKNENPIVYLEFLFGGGGTKQASGLAFGLGINYQSKKNLFTYRMLHVAEKNENAGLATILILPLFFGGDTLNEYALLYGKRFVFDGAALSIQVGVSQNLLKFTELVNTTIIYNRESYAAIPLEINYSFFKSRKKRFRVLYGLVPVGKPTGFGRSFGIKLFGSFGAHNYVGFGITSGLGWHKKYD